MDAHNTILSAVITVLGSVLTTFGGIYLNRQVRTSTEDELNHLRQENVKLREGK